MGHHTTKIFIILSKLNLKHLRLNLYEPWRLPFFSSWYNDFIFFHPIVSTPRFLVGFLSNICNLIPVRLNSTNYIKGKYQISAIFRAHALFGHLDHSTPVPEQFFPSPSNTQPTSSQATTFEIPVCQLSYVCFGTKLYF